MRALASLAALCAGCNSSPAPPAPLPTITSAPEHAPSALPPPPLAWTGAAIGLFPPAPGRRPPGCPDPTAPPAQPPGPEDAHIPGTLVVRAPFLSVQSHDIGDEPRRAVFCLDNLTDHPLQVRAGPLTIETTDLLVPEPERVQPLAFSQAYVDEQVIQARDGHVDFVVPPGRWTAIELSADAMPRRLYFRTGYVHRTVFALASASVQARSFHMYFLPPHRPVQP